MKISLALSQPPLPDGGAPGKCGLGLVHGLLEHGVDVTVTAALRASDQQWAPPDLPVEAVPAAEILSRPRLLLAKARRPRGELSRGSFDAALRERSRSADLLHLEETDCGWSAWDEALPRVLRVHYLAHLDLPFFGLRGRDPLRRAEEVYAEVRLARAHRWLVASSPVVADALRRVAPRSRVTVAPLTLDPRQYAPAPLDGPPVAGLIGTADWPPTRSALRRLVHRVWPRVRQRLPDARLVVAGRGTASLAPELTGDGVTVVGEVASATEFLRGLSALAYPVSRGSGMKVKVMEALACGVPVVTTNSGAEGIGATDGMVVREDDDGLVEALVELLRDDRARAERGAAGTRHFRDHLAPGPATEPLVDVYRDVLGR
jgi:glycosyltransferase involved in cell wall biosynthesis